MNQLDYIAENQRLKKEIEHLKAFPPVSVRVDVLDLALQCAELKAELEQVKAERDAAVKELYGCCVHCLHNRPGFRGISTTCINCLKENGNRPNWVWRGRSVENG